MTVATKQLVLREVGRKSTAKIAQSHLNIAARQQPAASMSEFGICLDRSFVPELQQIQRLQRNSKRAARKEGQFTTVDKLARSVLRQRRACIYYREADPTAPRGSPRAAWQLILSSEGCLKDAARYGKNGNGQDAKRKLVEDEIITNGVITFKRIDQHTHPTVPELQSGFIRWEPRLVCLSLSDKENQHTLTAINASIDRCLPCNDSHCLHGWKEVDFEDGSGFYMERTCAAAHRIKWTGPPSEGGSRCMIDMHEATANALRSLRMEYSLCVFHSDKAIAEHLSLKLLVSGATHLWTIMRGFRMLSREPTKAALEEGFSIFRDECLPQMGLSRETQAEIISYLSSSWMTEKWMSAWSDAWRCYDGVSSNNHIEKLWQELVKVGSAGLILKWLPEYLERLTGVGILGCTGVPCFFDYMALAARDQDAWTYRPRIETDVRRRHQLANCLLLADAVTELIPGKVYAVGSDMAPGSLLTL